MVSSRIKKGNSKLTLSINTKTLKKYKEYCEKEGLTISKQAEKFMEEQINGKENSS